MLGAKPAKATEAPPWPPHSEARDILTTEAGFLAPPTTHYPLLTLSVHQEVRLEGVGLLHRTNTTASNWPARRPHCMRKSTAYR